MLAPQPGQVNGLSATGPAAGTSTRVAQRTHSRLIASIAPASTIRSGVSSGLRFAMRGTVAHKCGTCAALALRRFGSVRRMATKAKWPARKASTSRGLIRETTYLHGDEEAALIAYERRQISKAETLRRALGSIADRGLRASCLPCHVAPPHFNDDKDRAGSQHH